MKGVRFYEVFTNKRKGDSQGNVIAVLTGPEHRCPDYTQECIASVFDYPNSPVASDSVSRRYLAKSCKRVPESRARSIHPLLFEWLDSEDE